MKPIQDNFKAIEISTSGNNYLYLADNLKIDFIAPNSLGCKTASIVDNVKNIDYESHGFMENEYQSQEFILSFSEIHII